ncbi:DUF6481 family protein [Ancylobacter sp. TS-1]|uniref:DUF6481 family protein n=1 Tax=Ancylobacter sp. TS-1 TaxID=1850374 RepID=UPI001265BB04|nr:DUF6481 family protein [Ancylobacter sp. TS-1]QFR31918.1 hypothetical protein GBB76_01620 [Ancylobacter sp. TS-1]
MKNIDSFQDRQKTANAARERMLARLASRPAADDPAVLARAAERRAIDEARSARRVERQEADAAQERQRIEAAAEHIAKNEADAKARRDARYAARKLRTGRAVD